MDDGNARQTRETRASTQASWVRSGESWPGLVGALETAKRTWVAGTPEIYQSGRGRTTGALSANRI